MFVFLIILLLLWLLLPAILRRLRPWLTRYLIKRATRYAARQAGFDPDFGRKSSKDGGRSGKGGGRETGGSRRGGGYSRRRGSEPVIPKEYAEDVEFTEIRDYSTQTVITPEGETTKSKSRFFSSGKQGERVEEQVSDAEIIEITED